MNRLGIMEKQSRWQVLVMLAAVSCMLIICWPGRFYFLNDDFLHIPRAAAGELGNHFLNRPVADLSLWLDYQIWGKDARGYHLTNLLIHFSNSFLVYLLVLALQVGSALWLRLKAFAAALLFLVYAHHSEPLFWIIGRGGPLATSFLLLSLLFILKKERKEFLFIALFFFTLGFFTYETSWVLPLILFALSKCKMDISQIRYKQAACWAMLVLLLSNRLLIQKKTIGLYEADAFLNFDIAHLVYNGNTLLARCFLPPMQHSGLFVLLYGAIFLGLFFILIKAKSKTLLFYMAAALISLLPVLSLGIDTHDTESERYIYQATVFIVLLIVELLFLLPQAVAVPLYLIFFSGHLVLLQQHARAYALAGSVAKQSVQALKGKEKMMVKAVGLPTQYRGAFIFRTGFSEAVHWLLPGALQEVEVQSQQEYTSWFSELYVQQVSTLGKGPADSSIKNVFGGQAVAIMKWHSDSLTVTTYP